MVRPCIQPSIMTMWAPSASVTTQPSYAQADYVAWFASRFYGAIKNEMRCLMYQSQIATCDELNEGCTTKHEAMIDDWRSSSTPIKFKNNITSKILFSLDK